MSQFHPVQLWGSRTPSAVSFYCHKTSFTQENPWPIPMRQLLHGFLSYWNSQCSPWIQAKLHYLLWHKLQIPNPTHVPGTMRIPKQQMPGQPAMVSNPHLKSSPQITSINTVPPEGFGAAQPRIMPVGSPNPGVPSFLNYNLKGVDLVE